uniref:lysophospholipid acyltransferase family protein n=1 Tax=Parasutterella excrementihominis TaxID=487175 RepID=UPI003FF0B4B4
MKLMLWLRALIFWFLFCITIICYGIVLFVCIPFTSKEGRYAIVKKWCRMVIGLMRTICGVRYEITGMDKVPATGPVILLSKHQSGWETLAFFAETLELYLQARTASSADLRLGFGFARNVQCGQI